MTTVDYLMYGGQYAMYLIILTLFVTHYRHSRSGRFGIAYVMVAALGIVCIVYESSQTRIDGLPFSVLWTISCYATDWFLWLFVLSVMRDSFSLKARHLAVLPVFAAVYFAGHNAIAEGNIELGQLLVSVLELLKLLFYLHILYVAFIDLRDDLVVSRKRFRMVFIAPVALYWLAALSFNIGTRLNFLMTGEQFSIAFLDWFFVLAGLVLTAVLTGWFFGPSRAAGVFDQNSGGTDEVPDREPGAWRGDVQERREIEERILQAMIEEDLFKKPGLTIGQLAGRLQQPEHFVRRVINQGMGFRNFSTFVNGYRIAAAKEMLADHPGRGMPVVNIAFDVGYQSLSSFNRTFKEVTGQTPTEYRRLVRGSVAGQQ